jgi:hypothetical protein
MRSEPDLVHGAWARRSASVDGSEHFETQHVIWLQAGTCYADLRVPFSAEADVVCFSGRSGWDVDGFRWRRRLDLCPVGGDDVAELTWDGQAIVERGLFPTPDGPVPYEEVWVRLPSGCGDFLALEGPDACLVQVGDHAVTVVDGRTRGGAFAAVYRRREAGVWVVQTSIGAAAESLPGVDDPPAWTVIHRGTAAVSA